MCGILGAVGPEITNRNSDVFEKMLKTLERRGPDEHALSFQEGCVLGQTRLSILDLSGGKQPMERGRYTIVFNGEIYNFVALRTTLEQEGHRFDTHSDTEVILRAYEEYGEDCVDHLDGMFAFGIWDAQAKRLFLARDRFGKKPLYFFFPSPKELIFASEIKTILASPRFQRKSELCPEALESYLAFGYVFPWMSIYKDIHPFPAAHCATHDQNGWKVRRYWSLPDHIEPSSITFEEAKDRVRELLTDAVQKRLVADVEVGCLLSGGVDSSLVAALAQKTHATPIKTFSAGFGDMINELPFAEEVASLLHTTQSSHQITENIPTVLKETIAYFDEPFSDSSLIPTNLICRFARREVKVVLSGDGADEVFLGYGWYWKEWNLGFKERLIRDLTSNPWKDHLRRMQHTMPRDRDQLWQHPPQTNLLNFPFLSDSPLSLSTIEKINSFDRNCYLPGDILTKVDRASMMNSLEVRCPFMDHHLIEYVHALPLDYKTDRHTGKILLKSLLEEHIPSRLIHRRKQGFSGPVGHWMQEAHMKELVYATLNSSAEIYRYLNTKTVQDWIKRYYEKGEKQWGYKIWTLLCLELWHQTRTL